MAGIMGGMGGGQSLVDVIQNALRQKGINAQVKTEDNKVFFTFTEEEVRKLFAANMPQDLMRMVTIEKAGELVLSMRMG